MALGRTAPGSQGGKVVADAPAGLHREGTLAQGREDALQAVLHQPHGETVEQGDVQLSARPCQNAATGQETEVLQNGQKAFPVLFRAGAFRCCRSSRHP